MAIKTMYEVLGWKVVGMMDGEPFENFITLYKTSCLDEAREYFDCCDYTDGCNAYQIDEVICSFTTTLLFKDEEHGLIDDVEELNNPGEGHDYDDDMYLM